MSRDHQRDLEDEVTVRMSGAEMHHLFDATTPRTAPQRIVWVYEGSVEESVARGVRAARPAVVPSLARSSRRHAEALLVGAAMALAGSLVALGLVLVL